MTIELRTRRFSARAAIVACGLVPLTGVAFLGWSAANVMFVLWLDAFLSSLRMIPANVHLINRDMTDVPGPFPSVRRIPRIYLGIVLWTFLALPVMLAGRYLDGMVAAVDRGGFEAQAVDLFFDAPWSFAVLVGSRLFQGAQEFAVARASAPARCAELLKILYGFTLFKGFVLFAVTAVCSLFAIGGARVLEICAGAIIIGLVAAELYADRWFYSSRPAATPPARKPVEIIHGFDGRK